MGKKKALRVNIGGKEDFSADVWRFWENNNSFYFFTSQNSHKIHISLHQSGVWKIDTGKDRFNLNREISICTGWGLGPRLFFPCIKADGFFEIEEYLNDERIIYLPSPKENEARLIQVVFEREKTPYTLDQLSLALFNKKYDWSEKILLKTKGVVHLISLTVSLSENQIKEYEDYKKTIKVHFDKCLPERVFANATTLDTPNDKESPSSIVSFPLGKETCVLNQ